MNKYVIPPEDEGYKPNGTEPLVYPTEDMFHTYLIVTLDEYRAHMQSGTWEEFLLAKAENRGDFLRKRLKGSYQIAVAKSPIPPGSVVMDMRDRLTVQVRFDGNGTFVFKSSETRVIGEPAYCFEFFVMTGGVACHEEPESHVGSKCVGGFPFERTRAFGTVDIPESLEDDGDRSIAVIALQSILDKYLWGDPIEKVCKIKEHIFEQPAVGVKEGFGKPIPIAAFAMAPGSKDDD